jgi:DNA modification methylase
MAKVTHPLSVEMVPLDDLRPYASNPRKLTRRRDRHLVASVETFGMVSPILADEDLIIIAGHGRLEAVKKLGHKDVPVIRLRGLTDAEKKALRIADNRIAEHGGWNVELLQTELQELVEAHFEIEATGYESIDLDKVLTPVRDFGPEDDASVPPIPSQPLSRLGDLWELGSSRLYCGDSRDLASYEQLLKDDLVELVATDPPYNRKMRDISGNGKTKHAEFRFASGEMSDQEFMDFQKSVLTLVRDHMADGALLYSFCDWRMIADLVHVGRELFDQHLNVCIWAKSNGGMGSFYRSAYEMCAIFKKGKKRHVNNIQFGRLGRSRTNVWHYDGGSSFSASRNQDLADHPTVKPIAMLADIIRDASSPDGLVLDPFGGAGSTLLAAHLTGRRAALIEIEPKFVDVTLRRFQERTGIEPTLLPEGKPLSAVREERLSTGDHLDG